MPSGTIPGTESREQGVGVGPQAVGVKQAPVFAPWVSPGRKVTDQGLPLLLTLSGVALDK